MLIISTSGCIVIIYWHAFLSKQNGLSNIKVIEHMAFTLAQCSIAWEFEPENNP